MGHSRLERNARELEITAISVRYNDDMNLKHPETLPKLPPYKLGAGIAKLTECDRLRQKVAVNRFSPLLQLLKQPPHKHLQPSFEKGRAWSEFVTNPANAGAIKNVRIQPDGYNALNPLAHLLKPKALPARQNVNTFKLSPEQQRLVDYITEGTKAVEHPNGLWLPTTARSVTPVSLGALQGTRRARNNLIRDRYGNFDPRTKAVRVRDNLDLEDFAATVGHEFGHSQQGLSLLYNSRVGGLNNRGLLRLSQDAGLSELVAHNNAIKNLIAARQVALSQGDRQAANLFDSQIGRLKREATEHLKSDDYISTSIVRQLDALRLAKNKKDVAEYMGMLSHLDDFSSRFPGLSKMFFPDGIPVLPQLRSIYGSFFDKANLAGLKSLMR